MYFDYFDLYHESARLSSRTSAYFQNCLSQQTHYFVHLGLGDDERRGDQHQVAGHAVGAPRDRVDDEPKMLI